MSSGMTAAGAAGARPLGRRGLLLLATLVATVGMFAALAAGPVAKAQAGGEYFCYYLAAPYGQSGDRCYSPNARWLTWVRAYGYDHSACSNAWKDGLVTNWACAPTATWSNSYFDGTRFMLGVIRNNNQSNYNQIWGYQEYL